MKKNLKKVKKFFTYCLYIIAAPKQLSDAINVASSPEELDELICGGNNEG